jgi:hypothetical protein
MQTFVFVAGSYLVGHKSYGLQMLKPSMTAGANGSHFAKECPANTSAFKAVKETPFSLTHRISTPL